MLVLMATLAGVARGEIAAQLAEGSAGAGRGWELIQVTFGKERVGEVVVSLQDVRGGVKVERQISVAAAGGKVWMPLPLVAPGELSGAGGGVWPVEVVIRAAENGRELERARVELQRDGVEGVRVAVSGGQKLVGAIPVEFSEEEILRGPAWLFAGCDVVGLPPNVWKRMSAARAMELQAVGVRLMATGAGTAGPPAGELSTVVWERSPLYAESPVWITAGAPVRRPVVVEPGLPKVAPVSGAVTMPAEARWALLGVGPFGMVVLLLARGMFHRRGMVLLASGVGMAVLTGVVLTLLRSLPTERQEVGAWRMAQGAERAVGSVMLEERLTRYAVHFSREMEVDGGEALIYPAAGTLRGYWDLRGLRLTLGEKGAVLGGTVPGKVVYVESRRVMPVGLLPAYPSSQADVERLLTALALRRADAYWLTGGYVRGAAAGAEGEETLWTPWAAGRQWVGRTGAAWYEMRYEAGARYLVFDRDGMANFVEYPAAAP